MVRFLWMVGIAFFLSATPLMAQEFDIASSDRVVEEEMYPFVPFEAKELQEKIDYALKSNDPETQYRLGRMYEDGVGVSIDYVIAAQWYEAAAVSKFVPAMVQLARMYLFGVDGVPAVPKRALALLREAEPSGKPMVFYQLGVFHEMVTGREHNEGKALEYYKKAARGGILNALGKLAIFYQYGMGVEANIRVALKYYDLLEAKAKSENVTNYVHEQKAAIYEEIAMAQDSYEERFKWMLFAAQLGRPSSIQQLAILYLRGQGTAQDYKKAAGWFSLAAAADDPFSMTQMGYLYLNGYGVAKDQTKALEWFNKAAELGDFEAAWNIGNIYHYGYGVAVDKVEADKWFKRSKTLEQKAQGKLTK